MINPENQHESRRGKGTGVDDLSPDALIRQLDAMQRDIAAMRLEANEASHLAMLGLLSASTAHELRNVLTPVLSYAQLARSRRSDSALVEKALERIVTGLKAAATILGGTLDHASPAREPARAHEAAVEEAVREVIAMLPRNPSHDGIDVSIDIERGLRAKMDATALRQVLLNLFLNAIAAMSGVAPAQARHRLLVRGRRGGGGGGALPVVVEISDTGPGVPPELAGRLFEPFAAGSSPAENSRSGTGHSTAGAGLGLSICRRLVEGAGGSITHLATPGGGATFRILLPAPAATLRKAG